MKTLMFVFMVMFIFLTEAAAAPVPVTLQWDSGDSTQTSFKLYSGPSFSVFDKSVDVGNVITYSTTVDIPANAQVCFRVTALNQYGESKPSNTVCVKAPASPLNFKQVQ